MNAREMILARVREALRHPAPAATHRSAGRPSVAEYRAVLPPVPAGYAARRALFAEHATALRAAFRCVSSRSDLAAAVAAIVADEDGAQVAAHGGALMDAVLAALPERALMTDRAYDVAELGRCTIGVTACVALIAQTGSVLLDSRTCGGRAVSVLPPHHVVLATAEQLVPDLAAGYDVWRSSVGQTASSFATLVTGPSRTGDIERILVLGAHGPKRLTILLLEEAGAQ